MGIVGGGFETLGRHAGSSFSKYQSFLSELEAFDLSINTVWSSWEQWSDPTRPPGAFREPDIKAIPSHPPKMYRSESSVSEASAVASEHQDDLDLGQGTPLEGVELSGMVEGLNLDSLAPSKFSQSE